jgi:outer membrane protein TolC
VYQASLVLGWDPLESLRSRPKVAELRAQERALREARHGSSEAVALEVRSSLLAAREARDQIVVQRRALVVAEEQARVARLAYREGLLTASEAQDAELALTAARFDLLRTRFEATVADAQLQLALGE